MDLLVLGSDGRTHALLWKLFNDPAVQRVVCTPGNGGTQQIVPSLPELDITVPDDLIRWTMTEHYDLIVPAEPAPLYHGLANDAAEVRLLVVGAPIPPALLGGSICDSREFLLRHNLPTPAGRAFRQLERAERFLAAQPLPVMLRADQPDTEPRSYTDRYEALQGLRDLFAADPLDETHHGVVIEAYHPGILVAFSAITDGTTALPLLPARIYNYRDATAQAAYAPGMGAHTGTSAYYQKLAQYLHQRLLLPTLAALAREQQPWVGILGLDCLITKQAPLIIGLRCTLRDMEAQVVLPRLKGSLLTLFQAAVTGRLASLPPIEWHDEATVGLALVSDGYPHYAPIGSPISGLDLLDEDVLVFHDQTRIPSGLTYHSNERYGIQLVNDMIANLVRVGKRPNQGLVVDGGHVLTLVARGATLQGARGRALLNAERISFSGRTVRSDVGARELT